MTYYEARKNKLMDLFRQGYTAQQLAAIEFLSIRNIYYYIGNKTGRNKPGRYESKEICECGGQTMPHRNVCKKCYNKSQRERHERKL